MEKSTEYNICRICLQRQDTLFSLFRTIQGSSPYEKLVNKTNLKIKLDDNKPSSICSQCLEDLDTTVSFLEKCEKSNEILASYDQESKASVECVVQRLEVEEISDEGRDGEVLPAPVTAAEAPCSACGSLRRCKHRKPQTTHTCQYCHKVFTRKFNFELHIKRHLGQKDWPCPVCGVKLLTQWLARRHCGPRPKKPCPYVDCSKSFTSITNLNTHIRTHNNERPYACIECDKRFTSKDSLKEHFRIHTGAKPFMCPICGRRFTTNRLSAHMRTHGGPHARSHPCAAARCGRTFATPRALRLHAATHAPAARRHRCGVCGAAYYHSQSLRKHIRRHTEAGTMSSHQKLRSDLNARSNASRIGVSSLTTDIAT